MAWFVYFLQSEHGGDIKIGKAKDVEKRRMDLQTGRPDNLVVLYTIKCRTEKQAYSTEAELHRRFSKCHHNREWFFPCKDLLIYLAENKVATPESVMRGYISLLDDTINVINYFVGK